MDKEREWLSLSEAAEHLGVHSTTLRRWAKNGDIPTMITPGGHRRFDAEDIARFSVTHNQAYAKTGLIHIWEQQAIHNARQGLIQPEQMHWLDTTSAPMREQSRQLGRRLLGLLITFASLEQGGDDLLLEAQSIGVAYADNAQACGLSLVDSMQALLFYRDMVVESAIEVSKLRHAQTDLNLRLIRRINLLLNTVQLALISSYT